MRLGTVKRAGATQAFRQDDNGTHYYNLPDIGALLNTENWQELATVPGPEPKNEELTLPILRPGKILCIGLNYTDHALEVGKTAPEIPTIFSKVASSMIGPYDNISYPELSSEIDWEAELVIVIGKTIKNADDESAGEAILGYTVMNDVSMRDWQRRTSEWFQGKNFDAISPLGPVIVSADAVDPIQGLSVETFVNGEMKQSGNTKDMIFNPIEVVKYLSQFLTLEPGDVIATGTPAGVGAGRKPKEFMNKGDVLVTRIEGIGELVNTLS
ncbi:MAG: fumarylacetoacetate hydrolase family protein [Microbacteriaceae bacterium]